MNIIEDSRQQADKHKIKHEHWEASGDKVLRCKLPFGDYSLPPKVAVDTKKDIYELAQDIDQEHQRFKNELINAREFGCKLIILVENEQGVEDLEDLAEWIESFGHYQMRLQLNGRAKRIEGLRLSRACRTMSERYGATFMFCSPKRSAELIKELLTDGG